MTTMDDNIRTNTCTHCSYPCTDCPNCGNQQYCPPCGTCNICTPRQVEDARERTLDAANRRAILRRIRPMKILVVHTCDDPAYFRADRRASKAKAIELAVDQVLLYDQDKYEEDDRYRVHVAKDRGKLTGRWQSHILDLLCEIGAVHVAELDVY